MNRNKKTLAVIAAALLAVSPVAASVINVPAAHTTVKAATQLSSDQMMEPYYNQALKDHKEYEGTDALVLKLTKANPYLTAYNGETVHQVSKRRITDVSSNYGRIIKRDGDVQIFKAQATGDPDFGAHLKQDDKLRAGQNYVAVISFIVDNTNEDNIVYAYYYDYDERVRTDDFYDGDSAALIVPVKVEPASEKPVVKKPTRKSSTKRAYVKVRKNRRVRTYTSSGKFSRHYVYGHHTYKVTSKKHIKGHGTCWKLSGKNQYVPAKYVRVR